jgi:mycothiol synthase
VPAEAAFALRSPTHEDVPAITRLFNRATEELYGESDETEDEVGRILESEELDPAEDIRVADAGGEIAGYADVFPHPHPTYWVDVRVPPSGGDAVRAALIEWSLRRVKEKGGELAIAAAWVDNQRDRRAYEAAGFVRVRGSYRMRMDFAGDFDEPRAPDGVSIRAMTPDDAQAAYETHMETFQDMWGHAQQTFEDWQHWFLDENHDWSLWFLAEADGGVAGVALCRRRPAHPDVGVVRVLGVRRPWRRKGVGRALLLDAFAEFQRRGMRAAILGVDAESLTGAQRLYASAGMYVERQSDVFEKRVA